MKLINFQSRLANNNIDLDSIVFSLIPSIFLSFLWLAFAQIVSADGANGSVRHRCFLSNIEIYILALFIFVFFFLISYYFVSKREGIFSRKDNVLFYFGIAMYVASIVFLTFALLLEDKYVFVNQTKWSFRHTLWFPCYIFLLAFIVNIFAYRIIPSDEKENKRFRVLLTLLLTLLVIVLTFSPNPFGDQGGGMNHFDAYINSIMNATKFVPYSYEVNAIYGHYGIFYIIPVKLLHFFITPTKWHAISLAIALTGGVTYALLTSVLNKLIRKDSVFFIASFAMGIWAFGFSLGNYYQGFPHRIFPQAVVIFFLMKLLEKPSSKTRKIIGLLIASACIVWNVEVGIVCTIVVCACLFVLRFQNNVKFFCNIFLSALELIVAMFVAYSIVAVYNVCAGGRLLSVREYIYPIASEDYHVIDMLQLRMDIPISLYFVYFVVMASTLCICGICILLRQSNSTIYLIFLCSIMGIGVFTYYMNRVCYANMQIATPMVVLILALIIDKSASFNVTKNLKRTINVRIILGKVALYVLMILSMESILNMGHIISFVRSTSYSYLPLQDFKEQIGELPEGTDAIGMGASVFATCILGKNMVYTMDWADMHPAGKEYCYNAIKNNDEIRYLVFEETLLNEVEERFLDVGIKEEYIYSDGENLFKWYLVELLAK